jgi:hypothetical protein
MSWGYPSAGVSLAWCDTFLGEDLRRLLSCGAFRALSFALLVRLGKSPPLLSSAFRNLLPTAQSSCSQHPRQAVYSSYRLHRPQLFFRAHHPPCPPCPPLWPARVRSRSGDAHLSPRLHPLPPLCQRYLAPPRLHLLARYDMTCQSKPLCQHTARSSFVMLLLNYPRGVGFIIDRQTRQFLSEIHNRAGFMYNRYAFLGRFELFPLPNTTAVAKMPGGFNTSVIKAYLSKAWGTWLISIRWSSPSDHH